MVLAGLFGEGGVSHLAMQSILQQCLLNPVFVCLAVHSLCGQSKLKQRAANRWVARSTCKLFYTLFTKDLGFAP